MFIIESYTLAVVFCFITMLCWGSWANTQKLVEGKWRFELFYWDYVIGIVILSLLSAFTLGSHGTEGRPFLQDLQQAEFNNLASAFCGGIVFNLANILLTAAIAGAGMAVAFPIGIGLALIIGVILNYLLANKGDVNLLFLGVLLIATAIILNGLAYNAHKNKKPNASVKKWIVVAIISGILMSSFYPFIAVSMDLQNFQNPALGKMTPYTAFVIFAFGIFGSNLIFNTILIKKPIAGSPLKYGDYFAGKSYFHFTGILGGVIWGIGNLLNLIAAGKAGPAVSYGLGQGATLVAALWGIAIWREFRGSNSKVNSLIFAMFICFILGIGTIIIAGKS
ncbi:GRP family sugar transporter [Pedobacter sp. PWIIR3]